MAVAQVWSKLSGGGKGSRGRPTGVIIPDETATVFKIHEVSSSEGVYVDPFVLGTTQPSAANTASYSDGQLPVFDGNMTITTPNAVIENLEIRGWVRIRAANVTVRFCRIVCRPQTSVSSDALVHLDDTATNAQVYQNEITCYANGTDNSTYYMNGIKMTGGSGTFTRNNIHDVIDAFYINGATTTLIARGNFIHDFCFHDDSLDQASGTPPNWSHNDGFQLRGGASFLIDGNYIRGTFSDVSGDPGTANPSGTPPFLWRNQHGMLAQAMDNRITNLAINRNWFAYGSIGIQFASNGNYTGSTASMSGNRIAPNQSLEFSRYKQFTIDDVAYWTVTGIGTTTYMDHPDTPSGLVGEVLTSTTGHVGPTEWSYSRLTPIPSPNGPSKPFV